MKLISLVDTTKISVLKGHTKAVRKATWHPSGSLLVCVTGYKDVPSLTNSQTTCGADGKVIIWDVSGDEPKEEKVIDGVIPAVVDSE